MTRPTGRLSLATDDSSDACRHKTTERPRSTPDAANIRYGAGPTLNHHEGADMAKRTRGPNLADSETRYSTVKITPVSSISATVPTTHTVA
jgi:hypothetical protein